MTPRTLLLLSPYRLPAQNSLTLGNEDVAAFLNGHAALWHPAAIQGAAEPPRLASAYDHEQPTAGHLYAVPDNPPLLLPDDWDQRVRDGGAIAFKATADRETTLDNLREALRASGQVDLIDLPLEKTCPFFGIGFGHIQIGALHEAMEHEYILAGTDFWQEVREAAVALLGPDEATCRRHLQAAADRLLAAREVLYPAAIHLVDIGLLDDQRLGDPLPAAFAHRLPLNLVACGALLEKLGRDHPDFLAALRERVAEETIEICGGPYLEREDALLPLESQLWNLLKGLTVSRDLLGADVRTYARKRSAFHPQVPLLLTSVGLHRVLLQVFDDSVLPTFRAPVVSWSSLDGQQVECFARSPYHADSPQTFFHAAHYLHQSIMQDQTATLALLHTGAPACPWYADWLELSRFAPVLGRWTTLGRYFNEVLSSEHASLSALDDFHVDSLSERTNRGVRDPVSDFVRHVRRRRQMDTVWTLAAIQRGLAGPHDSLRLDERLAELESAIEMGDEAKAQLAATEEEVQQAIAARLQAKAPAAQPGFLLLNPCGFARRIALEIPGITGPLPVTGPLKACQANGTQAGLVVEVPALGFAWVPRVGPPGTPPMKQRMRLADDRHVRNEFVEAEIDPTTGGLRGLCDHRRRINRLGQQLVFNPGSIMLARSIQVTSAGPALGEIVSEGVLLDEQEQTLATFRQRFRAWLGRPVLDLRVEIAPGHLPEGYPWHAYYGARFAWRDERALLIRGTNGLGQVTSHTRPETPDYLELRQGAQNTILFPQGLPFHQRHGSRMLDIILIPPGETAQSFDLALAIDREYPAQTALGLVTPVPLVSVAKGPPHVGASGWLFHLDAPNLLLTSMRPGPHGADSVTARALECGQHGGQAELRCIRNPCRATLVDARGETLQEVLTQDDAAIFEAAPGALIHLRAEFT